MFNKPLSTPTSSFSSPSSSMGKFSLPSSSSTPSAFSLGGLTSQQGGQQQGAKPALFAAAAAKKSNQAASITGGTTFEKLPDVVKAELRKLQSHMQKEKTASEMVAQHSSAPLDMVSEDVESAFDKLGSVESSISKDMVSVRSLTTDVYETYKHADELTRELTLMKSNERLSRDVYLPPEYFAHLEDAFERRMQRYKQTIEEIDRYLSSGTTAVDTNTLGMLQEIMRNQHEFFLSAAAQVASLHEMVDDKRLQFLEMAKTSFSPSELDSAQRFFSREKEKKSNLKYIPYSFSDVASLRQELLRQNGAAGGAPVSTATPFGGGGGGGGLGGAKPQGSTLFSGTTGGGMWGNKLGGTAAGSSMFAPKPAAGAGGMFSSTSSPFAAAGGAGKSSFSSPFAPTTAGQSPFSAAKPGGTMGISAGGGMSSSLGFNTNTGGTGGAGGFSSNMGFKSPAMGNGAAGSRTSTNWMFKK